MKLINLMKWGGAILLMIALTSCGSVATKQINPDLNPAKKEQRPLTFLQTSNPPKGMNAVAENPDLLLYLNKDTAEIALKDKKSGKTLYSNPQDRDQDTISSLDIKERLASQFTLSYFTNGGVNFYNSYTDSVKLGQFTVDSIAQGIQVHYQLGQSKLSMNAIPKAVEKKRFEENILSKVKAKSEIGLLRTYYFIQGNENVYERSKSISDVGLEKVYNILQSIGYTAEDLKLDNAENNVQSVQDVEASAKFQVSLSYQLEGDQLVVSLSTQDISQMKDYPVNRISLLEFFGAAGMEEAGYMVVPDGSGELIYLNNQKNQWGSYHQAVYGADLSLAKLKKPAEMQNVRLPIFGLKQKEQAYLAIIDQGDAIADIDADVSGQISSFNHIYSSFTMLSKDVVEFGALENNSFTVFQNKPYQGEISVRYKILADNEANYADMAAYYRNFLIEKKQLTLLKNDQDLPFYLDLIGDIPDKKSFLGIPYHVEKPLTTFEQSGQMIDELIAANVTNIKVRYLGWFNGGLEHSKPSKISIEGALGGTKPFNELILLLNEKKIDLYPDVQFQKLNKSKSGVSSTHDAAWRINKKPAMALEYNKATQIVDYEKTNYYLTSPTILDSLTGKFLKAYARFGINQLSLADLGRDLIADYREGRVVDRQSSKEIIVNQLRKMSGNGKEMMISAGNAYSFPFAKHIIDAPLGGSHFSIEDEEIPFYEMVLHGFIEYAGEPLNLADDQNVKKSFLKAIEYGSNARFKWFYESGTETKDFFSDNLNYASYKDQLTQAVTLYQELNHVLKDVQSMPMVAHQKLQEGVFVTEYANGKKIYVNYNDTAVTVDQKTVQPFGYAVVEGRAEQ